MGHPQPLRPQGSRSRWLLLLTLHNLYIWTTQQRNPSAPRSSLLQGRTMRRMRLARHQRLGLRASPLVLLLIQG